FFSTGMNMPSEPDYVEWVQAGDNYIMSDKDIEEFENFDPDDDSWENLKIKHRFCGRYMVDVFMTACSVCPDDHRRNPQLVTEHETSLGITCCKHKCSFFDIINFCCGGYE
ncbi:hypothetical protein PMAYCL1PPCAC_21799, partial [Pristionchus mayeri]